MAILIGCSSYSELPALPAVSAGLIDLCATLTDPLIGGFAPSACQVIAEPAQPGHLARAVLEAARTTQDTLLLYYAGHGVLDEDNNLHLALTDTSSDPALVPDTALPYARIRTILRASPARNRIVVLDCCFAGRAIHDMAGPDLSARAVVTGTYVLAATAADKTARGTNGARHTAFTGALLDLLHDGIAEGPDLLTLEAIYPHLRHALLGRGLPEPRRQGTDTIAGLALTRNPRSGRVPEISRPFRGLTAFDFTVEGMFDLPKSPTAHIPRRVLSQAEISEIDELARSGHFRPTTAADFLPADRIPSEKQPKRRLTRAPILPGDAQDGPGPLI